MHAIPVKTDQEILPCNHYLFQILIQKILANAR